MRSSIAISECILARAASCGLVAALLAAGWLAPLRLFHPAPSEAASPVLSRLPAIDGPIQWPPTSSLDVFGGRRMSGFVVIADDAPHRFDVSTIGFAAFSDATKSLRSAHQDFLQPSIELPFGFVNAPALHRPPEGEAPTQMRKDSDLIFIVPVEVVEQSHVEAWRFERFPRNFKPNRQGYGPWVYYVVKASPLRIPNNQ